MLLAELIFLERFLSIRQCLPCWLHHDFCLGSVALSVAVAVAAWLELGLLVLAWPSLGRLLLSWFSQLVFVYSCSHWLKNYALAMTMGNAKCQTPNAKNDQPKKRQQNPTNGTPNLICL